MSEVIHLSINDITFWRKQGLWVATWTPEVIETEALNDQLIGTNAQKKGSMDQLIKRTEIEEGVTIVIKDELPADLAPRSRASFDVVSSSLTDDDNWFSEFC